MNYTKEMVAATLGPIVFVAIVCLYYLISSALCALKSKEDQVNRSHRYTHAFLVTTYIVIIGSSTKPIHYFKCEEYALPDGSHERYLSADVSIDCDGDEWEAYSKYAAVMILVYPVGIPLMYYVMIYRQRRILSDEALVEAERANGSPTIGHLDFLVAPYKSEHYNFEVLETVRRLLLAAIVGVVSANAVAAPVLGIIISAVFQWAFTKYEPYRNDGDNDLSVLLSFGLVFLFLAALLIKVDATSDAERDQVLLGALLIIVLFSGPIMLALILIRDMVLIIKERFWPANRGDGDNDGVVSALAGAGSATGGQAAASADGLIHASFPAGRMDFGICEKNGRFVVTKSSGVAMEQGVEVNDEVVQIGTVVLADKFKDVENDQRFNEVSRMIGTFPRPLTVVFAKSPGCDVESMHSIRSLSGDRPPSIVVGQSLDQEETDKVFL